MARQTTNQGKSNSGTHHGGRSSKNAYKVGKLSKKSRFSTRKINHKLIFVLLAIVLSFVLAMILGNHLSKKAAESQNTTPPDTLQNTVIPSPDKVSPKVNLNAFYVDFADALPPTESDPHSLSNQTSIARNNGNALFVELVDKNGNFIYSSDAVNELSVPHNENLTLKRLNDHFRYYNDYAVGYFKSSFFASADASERTKVQSKELLLLSEASDKVFSQLIVEFSGNIAKNNLIYYQTYLLNLKLACESTSIGIKIPLSFVTSAANHGVLAELMKIADFYVLDLSDKSAEQIAQILSPLAFFNQKYSITAILPSDEETLSARILALKGEGIKNYVVK